MKEEAVTEEPTKTPAREDYDARQNVARLSKSQRGQEIALRLVGDRLAEIEEVLSHYPKPTTDSHEARQVREIRRILGMEA